MAALRPGGRLVVNAVTLETEAVLIARHAAPGGELIRIALSRASAVGGKTRLASGHAGDAMGLDQAMIVAGIGCRAGASARDIEAAHRRRAGAGPARSGRARPDRDVVRQGGRARHRGGGLGARHKARRRCRKPSSKRRARACTTRSERVLAITGVPSVAEAAALAAAGPGARLLVPRVAVGPATCALAIAGDEP